MHAMPIILSAIPDADEYRIGIRGRMKENMSMAHTGKRGYLLLFLFSTVFLFASAPEEPAESGGTLTAFVSIPPQAYLIERIGGEHVSVYVLVKSGQDPHVFEPTPKQMVALNEADVYFALGFPFEEQVLKKVLSTNPRLVIAHTDRGIVRRTLDEYLREEKGEPDPHIWIGPEELRIQARNVYEGLSRVDPNHEDFFRKNLESFLGDLDAVDERLARLLTPYRGKSFFVFHPAFGYFADAYGLIQVPIEIEGKSPTPKQIETLIEKAREEGVRIIFVQPQFDKRSADTIAQAIDGTVVSIDPLERDLLRNLEDLAQNIESALR